MKIIFYQLQPITHDTQYFRRHVAPNSSQVPTLFYVTVLPEAVMTFFT